MENEVDRKGKGGTDQEGLLMIFFQMFITQMYVFR